MLTPSSDASEVCSSEASRSRMLDFYDVAALDAINRRPRNTELFSNFIRRLAATDPVCLEAAPDFAQFRHSRSAAVS